MKKLACKSYSLDIMYENGNGMTKYSSLKSTTHHTVFLFGYTFSRY